MLLAVALPPGLLSLSRRSCNEQASGVCAQAGLSRAWGAAGVPDKPKREKRARSPPLGFYDDLDAEDSDAEEQWCRAVEDILEDEEEDDEDSDYYSDWECERLDAAIPEYARAMTTAQGRARDHLPKALQERARMLMERGAPQRITPIVDMLPAAPCALLSALCARRRALEGCAEPACQCHSGDCA